MAKPPDCGDCKKPATIHLTQIVNNQVKKLDFCEDCPHQKAMSNPEGFSLAELLAQSEQSFAQLAGGDAKLMKLRCSHCGMTPADFKKTGRFGCARCYADLAAIVEPMLTGMHKGVRHKGKVPKAMLDRVALKYQLSDLQDQLREAVEEERYEDAAKLRDEIERLRLESLRPTASNMGSGSA